MGKFFIFVVKFVFLPEMSANKIKTNKSVNICSDQNQDSLWKAKLK